MKTQGILWIGLAASLAVGAASAQPAVVRGEDGRVVVQPAANGDRIPDFSTAGYRGGGVALPMPSATIRVRAGQGDDGDRIRAAVARAAARAADADGVRGVVLLSRGRYEIEGRIELPTGVILRGEGAGEDGTVLIATGVDRRSLIQARGAARPAVDEATCRPMAGAYVPAGATTLKIEGAPFAAGAGVVVQRPSTQDWIHAIGMDRFPGWRPENRLHWQPGSRDLTWDRTVVAASDGELTLDAPITTALDPAFGGGRVCAVTGERMRAVGVENLRLVSASDPERPMDEDHAWFGVSLDGVEDGWVRDVTGAGFVGGLIHVGRDARRISVFDVRSVTPVSEVGGYRRRTFHIDGQQVLFARCRSEKGIHDFSLGHGAAGPNVFLDCTAEEALGDSGPQESWASGVLFDRVKVRGEAIRLTDRNRDRQGAGWSAANSVLWNCEATDVEVRQPPGAWNIAVGCRGETVGDGVVDDDRAVAFRDFFRGEPVEPSSLYETQLAARLGEASLSVLAPAAYANETPPELTAREIAEWREGLPSAPVAGPPLRLVDGEFRIGDRPAWTRQVNWSWFQAQLPPSLAARTGPAITRFAPGLAGPGLTDDLETVADGMTPGSVFVHHYGLWYDRRRVDHNYYGSPDQRTGEVWAPFIEVPWARSGQGKAWDGLSKYDLTRFNPWFFDRARAFGELADQRGFVLYANTYFQHWLLESRAHYVDFAWRPQNTIQTTGLPDQVPAAETFYDLSDPVRRDLHRLYIRHTLDSLKGVNNVVYGIDREYTGPLEFLRFWLDTIAEWERENRTDVFVALEVPKDQMDAVLADPVRGPRIDAIGFHAWVYRPDGSLFASRGGINRAPRQQVGDIVRPQDAVAGEEAAATASRLWASSPAMKYRALREYRDRWPRLAVLMADDDFPELTRAVEAAIPRGAREALGPSEAVRPNGATWASENAEGTLVYSPLGEAAELSRSTAAPLSAVWVMPGADPITTVLPAGETRLTPPASAGSGWAVWLSPRS